MLVIDHTCPGEDFRGLLALWVLSVLSFHVLAVKVLFLQRLCLCIEYWV